MHLPTGELTPIDEVARQLGVRASAIRYWEDRGLVEPASRHSGRRWYGQDEIRRLAIIRYWQSTGLMSLADIGQLLAGPGADRPWPQLIDERLRAITEQIARLTEAREFLEHVTSWHPDAPPDGCPHYEALIFGPSAGSTPRHQSL